jgi:hypothetical protein
MAANSFRRDRQRGITQAAITRSIRAAKAADPDAIVEVDPISNRIRILNGAPAAKENAVNPTADEALKEWQKKHADNVEGSVLDASETR